MYNKRLTSFIAITVLIVMLVSLFSSVTFAEEKLSGNNDIMIDSQMSYEQIVESQQRDEVDSYSPLSRDCSSWDISKDVSNIKSVPSSIDISTHTAYSCYFPPVSSQGGLPSCTCFALVYYTYTYTANRYNGIATTAQNAYSPKWAYNATNCYDANTSPTLLMCSPADIVSFTAEHGALKQADFPYSGNASNPLSYTELPSAGLSQEMIDALKTRVEGGLEAYSTSSTATQSIALSDVKAYIASGNVVPVEMAVSNLTTKYSSSVGEYVITRVGEGGNHFVTIVGYNDNVGVDINNNGQIEASEKGAFKLVNSYGLTDLNSSGNWGTSGDGYFWVSYDALRKYTNVSGNWQSGMTSQRIPAFSDPYERANDDWDNKFYHYSVSNYDTYYIARMDLTASRYCGDLTVSIGKRNSYSASASNYSLHTMCYPGLSCGEKDCDNLIVYYDLGAVQSELTSYRYFWLGVETSHGTVTASTTLRDDLNQQLYYTNLLSGKVKKIKNVMGDVNYSGSLTTADVSQILSYIAGTIDFSSLQFYLADRNGNGVVNNVDANGYLTDIANN